MTDAIALLAISQLVCLGAIFYLYVQLQAVKSANPIRKRPPSARVQRMVAPTEIGSPATARAARAAYGANPPAPAHDPAATLAARIGESGVDVAALARRMRKSEEEVRLLLRRQGIPG
ncbi:MAG: hypothetical protein M9925_13135 [Chloroflexi bacterium]|jgi:hypothetical protein|nr:hypothetical protein [Chloroflexota bacterium]